MSLSVAESFISPQALTQYCQALFAIAFTTCMCELTLAMCAAPRASSAEQPAPPAAPPAAVAEALERIKRADAGGSVLSEAPSLLHLHTGLWQRICEMPYRPTLRRLTSQCPLVSTNYCSLSCGPRHELEVKLAGYDKAHAKLPLGHTLAAGLAAARSQVHVWPQLRHTLTATLAGAGAGAASPAVSTAEAKKALEQGDSLAAMEAFTRMAAEKEKARPQEEAERREGLLNETSFDRRRQIAVYRKDGKKGHHMQVCQHTRLMRTHGSGTDAAPGGWSFCLPSMLLTFSQGNLTVNG